MSGSRKESRRTLLSAWACRGAVAWLLALVALTASVPLCAETFELPIELLIDTGALAVELSNADVRVVFEEVEEPIVRVSAKVSGDQLPGGLEVGERGAALVLGRSPGEGKPPRWNVELVLEAGQDLRISGADLDVSARNAAPPVDEKSKTAVLKEKEEEAEGRGAGRASRIELVLESSQADLQGLRGVVAETTESSLWLNGTSGPLTLDMSGGTVESVEHRGSVELATAGTGVTLTDLVGNLEVEVEGGSLSLQGGVGALTGTVAGAEVTLAGRKGRLELEAEHAVIEARSVTGGSAWQLDGVDLQVDLEGLEGPLTATLEGGRLKAAELGGKVTMAGESGAVLEVSSVGREFELELSDASQARVSNVAHLTAEVSESTLRVERARQLTLSGSSAEIYAEDIGHLAPVQMSDSQLDLHLEGITNRPTLDLSGNGRARVSLSIPCVVRTAAVGSGFEANLQVTGCEIRNPGQPLVAARGRLLYGTNRPVMLVVAIGEGVELEVEGTP